MNIIDDRTTKESVLADYKNYPATMEDLDDKPFYESRLAPILYEVPKGSTVLDVGCNDGVFMKMLQEKRNCFVKGIDVSETALEAAKKSGLDVQLADAEALPFPDESFDVVVCMEVLSHLFDPSKALKEIRRVLKPKGMLLGSCPHKNIETYAWEDKRMHRRYFDIDQLHLLIGESFEQSWIRILTGAQFAMSMAGSFLANEPCEMLFKAGTEDILGWDAELQDRSILRCWLGFTQGPGTVYYRMSGFADKMQKLGAEVHYNPYNEEDQNSTAEWAQKVRYSPTEKRFINAHIVNQLEQLLKASDMSVFQVTSSRDVLLLLTTAKKGVIKKPLYTELDDWIFDIPSYNFASTPYHPNSESEAVAYDQLKLSDGFIVSTNYLKEKLGLLCPGKPIYVVKNSIDFDIWDKVQVGETLHKEKPDLVRIGYTGCSNHSGDLEIIKKPLLALLEEFPNLEFVTLPFETFKDINHPRIHKLTKWTPLSQFPQEVASWELDIGIAPLRDNELNRAKSNLRWLEYSALHLPTIASRVYPFEHSILNNKDGLLVSNNAKDWYEAMSGLIVEKGKRTRIGDAAYKRVKKEFNMDMVAKTYLSILKTIKSEFITDSIRVQSLT